MKWAVLVALCLTGCATDYAKISNKQACGQDDCGRDPGSEK